MSRLLDNEKYVGRWTWTKTESRRDPRTGRRRRFAKPESEWVTQKDESLRIVPQDLWNRVRARRNEVRRTWPGAKGKRGFSDKQGGREKHFPTHLLSGTMVCAACGAAIAQVSRKGGGYYGCLGAARGACDSKMLVPRNLAESVIVEAVQEELFSPNHVRYVLEQVEHEASRLYSDISEAIRLKGTELASEERRLEALREELSGLRRSCEKVFQAPPVEWIEERLGELKEILERRTEQSALLLRKLLGPISLEPPLEDVVDVAFLTPMLSHRRCAFDETEFLPAVFERLRTNPLHRGFTRE